MLAVLGGGVAAAALFPFGAQASPDDLITKKIPSSGEKMPVIGMGTWQTFNVGGDPELLAQRAKVLAAFFKGGGRIIDSSPMYGSSQDAVGWRLNHLNKSGDPKRLFAADKVWTSDGDETYEQIIESRKEWDIPRFDLMQVHNLVAWKEHLPKLQKLKADKKIRYVGITTSHGRRHGEFEEVMKTQELDFVQLTYLSLIHI